MVGVTMPEVFTAGVQYGDWKGTVAADEAHESLHQFLRNKGVLGEGSYVVAIRFFSGDNFGGKAGNPWIRFVVADGAGHDDIQSQIAAEGTLKFKEIDIELSLEEFFALFKRFSIVLTSRDLGLEGREYQIIEEA